MHSAVKMDRKTIEAFCQRWKVQRLWLYGSALRDDFHAASDIDLLVEFQTEADWSLLDHVAMEQELSEQFGRSVDLVTRRAVEQSKNTIRRQAILDSAEPIYVAG